MLTANKVLEKFYEIRTVRPLDEDEQDMLLLVASRLDAILQNMTLDLRSTIQVADQETEEIERAANQ
jgi:hypothetical protein